MCFSGVPAPHRPEGAEERQREEQAQRWAAEPEHRGVRGPSPFSPTVPVSHLRRLLTLPSRFRRWSTCRRRPAAGRDQTPSETSSPQWCTTNSPSRCILTNTRSYVMFHIHRLAVFSRQGRKTSTPEPQATDCSGNPAGEFELVSVTTQRQTSGPLVHIYHLYTYFYRNRYIF